MYAMYLGHLDAAELGREARRVAQSSKAIGPYPEQQLEAMERLEGIPEGQVLPALLAIRNGPSWVPMDVPALEAKVDRMVSEMYRDRFTRKAVP